MKSERVISMNEHGCYFLTLETVDSFDIFIRPVYKQIIVHSLNHFIDSKGLIVYGWCLMSNRLYLICQAQHPLFLRDLRLEFKKFTAEKIIEAIYNEPFERHQWMIDRFQTTSGFLNKQKRVEVWKTVRELTQIDMNRAESMAEFLERIHNVPVQERVVQYAADYLYSSARDYENDQQGLVKATRLSAVECALDSIESRKSIFKSKINR